MQGIQLRIIFLLLSLPPCNFSPSVEISLEFVQIGDLGLSKIKQRTLVSGGVRGTVPWMAPELLNSNSKNNLVTEKVNNVHSLKISEC